MVRHRICRQDEIAPGEFRRIKVKPPAALYRTETGFYAIDDVCTHAFAILSQGHVEDDEVECPVHLARFCLKTGRAMGPPATVGVAVHPVIIEDGEVFVDLDR